MWRVCEWAVEACVQGQSEVASAWMGVLVHEVDGRAAGECEQAW